MYRPRSFFTVFAFLLLAGSAHASAVKPPKKFVVEWGQASTVCRGDESCTMSDEIVSKGSMETKFTPASDESPAQYLAETNIDLPLEGGAVARMHLTYTYFDGAKVAFFTLHNLLNESPTGRNVCSAGADEFVPISAPKGGQIVLMVHCTVAGNNTFFRGRVTIPKSGIVRD